MLGLLREKTKEFSKIEREFSLKERDEGENERCCNSKTRKWIKKCLSELRYLSLSRYSFYIFSKEKRFSLYSCATFIKCVWPTRLSFFFFFFLQLYIGLTFEGLSLTGALGHGLMQSQNSWCNWCNYILKYRRLKGKK